MIENHDEAYYLWRETNFKSMILVHVDAHHDMWRIFDQHPVTTGDFIYASLKEGIVERVYWVVPTQCFENPAAMEPLEQNVIALVKQDATGNEPEIRIEPHRITATVLGRPLIVCAVDELPVINEPVLLDVDVDYFLLPAVSPPGKAEVPSEMPWCWPPDLVAKLGPRVKPVMITIAYSVEGGTTPLKWKYLGDELKSLLDGDDDPTLRCFEMIRKAAIYSNAGEIESGIKLYEQHAAEFPNQAATQFHLAHLYAKQSADAEATKCYSRALSLDTLYKTAYNSAAIALEQASRLDEAEREHRDVLQINPNDFYAYLGLARIAMRRRRCHEARTLLEKGLTLKREMIDAQSLLGDACMKLGDPHRAILAYEAYFELQGSGHKSLNLPISTIGAYLDPQEIRNRASLARAYQQTGNSEKALRNFQILADKLIPRESMFLIKLHFALLLWGKGELGCSLSQLCKALGWLPRDMLRALRKSSRYLLHQLRQPAA